MKVKDNPDRTLRFVLSSGDNDEYPGCKLHMAFWKWATYVKLPPIIKPDLLEIRGKYNYDQYIERRYGMYLFENHFNVMYGRGDANFNRDIFGEEQRWSCFLPWSEWRHVRHSLYGLEGEHIYSQQGCGGYDEFRKKEEACPKMQFSFTDFDGEEINAVTHIEEREWRLGEGWFKWLSLFREPKTRRYLEITFSKETGKKKGSWKGGVIGTSIELEHKEELHDSAFKRYCESHNMVFGGRV